MVAVRVEETGRGLVVADGRHVILIPWGAVEMVVYDASGRVVSVATRFRRLVVNQKSGLVEVFHEGIPVDAFLECVPARGARG